MRNGYVIAKSAGISYIDNSGIIDRVSGDLRHGMLESYHYTPVATKIVAKELKRSLYANEPRNVMNSRQPKSAPKSSTTDGLLAAMEGFFKKTDLMLNTSSN